MHLVVIGNGVAGMEAALTVRQDDPNAQITIVSEESDNFFSRTALMWVLCGQMSHRDIEPLERDAYARLGFNRVRDRATRIDTQGQRVQLTRAAPLDYDALVIACGSAPRQAPWPGSEARGVGHFVTLQDLEWLSRELHGGPSGGGRPPNADALRDVPRRTSPYVEREGRRGADVLRPAVIGGGLIGIEAIECMIAAGHQPDFFIREEWFWPMALDTREAAWITARLEEHGVRVHLEHNVTKIEQQGDEMCAVVTDYGRYVANMCVVAIGVVPNTAWLNDTDIQVDSLGGITVDPQQRTSAPHVYAAGDCASVRWADGRIAPEQLWYTARDQGRVAGRNIVGTTSYYERGVFYNSAKLMDIEYTTVGDLHDEQADVFFFEEHGKVRSTTRILSKGGKVTGFNLLGRRWDHTVLIEWVEAGQSLDWVCTHLSAASFDTEFVPPLSLAPQQGQQG